MFVFFLLFGVTFGWVLSRSGAADYNVIQSMFLFEDFQLYGILACAVAVTAPGLWLLKRRGIEFPTKALHRGNLIGGAIFGVGWSITGMCPGPILVNVGEGKLFALAALAGALVGTSCLGILYPRLSSFLGLPNVK